MSNNPIEPPFNYQLGVHQAGNQPGNNFGGNPDDHNANDYYPNNLPDDNAPFLGQQQQPYQNALEQQANPENFPRPPSQTAKAIAQACPILIILVTIGFAGFSLITAVSGFFTAFGDKYVTMNDGAGVLRYASTSLKSSLIIDVALATDGVCPAGYDIINFGTWPGTERGCDCGDGDITAGACGDSQTMCREVYSENPVKLSVWRGISLCAKRSSQVTYTSGASCQPGYKKCYRDICVRSNEECYITDIVMRSPKGSDNLKPVEATDIAPEGTSTASASNQIDTPKETSVTVSGENQTNLTSANATTNATTNQAETLKPTSAPSKPDIWSTITSSSPDLPWNTANSPDPYGFSWSTPSFSSQSFTSAGSPDQGFTTQTSLNSANSPDFASNFGSNSPDVFQITSNDLSSNSPDVPQALSANSPDTFRASSTSNSPDIRGTSAESPDPRYRRMLAHESTSQTSFESSAYLQTNSRAPSNTVTSNSTKTFGPYETKGSNGLRTNITIDSKNQLRFFRRVGVSPITGFAITTDNLPCLASNRDPMPNSSLVYPLLNSKPTGCGTYGIDKDSMILDTLQEEELYIENGMTNHIETLPEYTDFIANNIEILSVRPRVRLNPSTSCFQLDLSDSDTISSKADSLISTNVIFLALTAFLAILEIAIVFLFCSEQWKQWTPIAIAGLLLLVGLQAGLLYVFNTSLQTEQTTAQPLSDSMTNLANKKCFTNTAISGAINELSSALPEYIAQSLSLVAKLSTAALIMLVVEMILMIIYGIASKLSD